MLSVTQRVEKLRELMKENGIDIYVVPTADYHQSEYVGEHFKARKFITGFTGSAGTAVITADEAGLWTDGRYFLQAERQMSGTPVKLFKMGEPEVPTIPQFIYKTLKEGGVIGFDGRTVTMDDGESYQAIANEKGGKLSYDLDLINQIWEDRPSLSTEKAFTLDVQYAGQSVAEKLERIRKTMKENEANVHLLTTLDDVCWTLNIRGNDIEFFPLVLSYAIITLEDMKVYMDKDKLGKKEQKALESDGIIFRPYNDIYEDIKELKAGDRLLLDPMRINFKIYSNIPDGVKKVKAQNPEILFKAMKNEVEIKNIRKAEIKDSIVHIKFMKWLKENHDKMTITELSASAKLDELREAQGNYLRPSFAPICAYADHAANPHYESSPETDVPLSGGNFFLTDTGAGFLEGSTDITRTYAIGDVTKEMKKHFTIVAISNLSLADAKFLHGSNGMVLDILARKPFWDRDLNFNHGTGHGVGYLLNIHEAPTGFRWLYREHEIHPLEAGMILTDEPGVYFEGEYGIRLENELLVKNGTKNEYGQFMNMEAITYVPFDLDAIDPSVMNEQEKTLLNNYHKKVYDVMAEYLDEDEKKWLKHYTREI